MASEDIKEIFNSFLPNIYIGVVTLENKGGTTRRKVDPHIDYEGEGMEIPAPVATSNKKKWRHSSFW